MIIIIIIVMVIVIMYRLAQVRCLHHLADEGQVRAVGWVRDFKDAVYPFFESDTLFLE